MPNGNDRVDVIARRSRSWVRILSFLAPAVLLLVAACTPSDAALLEGILQNVDSANGEITIVTKDGRTITLIIRTDATVESDGVTVSRVKAVPGLKFDVTREDDRIVQITWTMDVHPGSYAEFQFIARNPEEGTALTWKAQAMHPDGTSTDWVNARGEPQPASVTSLVAAAN